MNRENSRKALISLTDELREFYQKNHREREEGEFTTDEFAEANQLDRKTAENFLGRCVRQKILSRRKDVFIDGRFRTAYKKV